MRLSDMILQFVFSGLTAGAIYALVALGFALVHNATGIVNFAQVDFVTLGGMMLYTFFHQLGLPMWPGLILSILAVTLVGAGMELLALRPARSREPLILIFITIAASIFIRGIMEHVWGKNAMALPPLTQAGPVEILGAAVIPQTLWILGITGLAVILLRWYFRNTRPGKAMRAVADNPRAAALAGIDVRLMITLSFSFSGGLGALAGALIVPITSLVYNIGVMIGLKGFAAAILGGYGSFPGAILGGLCLGLLESLGAGLVSSTYKDVIAFLVLLLVLFVRPAGLLGRGKSERV